MCGRYYVDEIHRIAKNTGFSFRTGDIRPSETAVVFDHRSGKLVAENMVWGYPGYQGKNLLINARSEGILEKQTFRDDILARRCVIPAKGFYEWSAQKEKYWFEDGSPILFLAGCFNAQRKFVIITTSANASVLPIHSRMPLLLSENEMEGWLFDEDLMKTKTVLQKTPQLLNRQTDYEQLSFFS
ncbi:MAG: SOS response-associated peptidase [Lachnospiraceae bacterium]|nr:SOS response-associated peptidase [Lachnospiraceae bacterium]